jgi:hypothetical protein
MSHHSGTDLLGLVRIEAASLFITDMAGRIVCETDPVRSIGPLIYLTGCDDGNIVLVRHDISTETATAIEHLVSSEPPLSNSHADPVFLDEYIRLLASEAPVKQQTPGLIYSFPEQFSYSYEVDTVSSGTPAGESLLENLHRQMPMPLLNAGFRSVADLWPPWSVAIADGEIASVCITARLADEGVEAGITTLPAFRGRGLASVATAAWATHSAHGARTRFYSVRRDNIPSRRVAEKLGLFPVGVSYRVG